MKNNYIFYFLINMDIQKVAVICPEYHQHSSLDQSFLYAGTNPHCGEMWQTRDMQPNVWQPRVKSGQFLAFYWSKNTKDKRLSFNISRTTRNFGTRFSPFVKACWCAHFEKKIMTKSLLVAEIFLKEDWRWRFSRIFSLFYREYLDITLQRLGIWGRGFFHRVQNFKSFICSPNRITKFKAVAEIFHVSWGILMIFPDFPQLPNFATSACNSPK